MWKDFEQYVNYLSNILLQEVKVAAGCTEAAAIGLAIAAAKDEQKPPYDVEVALDYDTYKNAINVGVPGGKGIKSAILMGLNSDWRKKLEVLSEVKPVSANLVSNISIRPLPIDALFIYARVNNSCSVIISTHDNIIYRGPRIELREALSMFSPKRDLSAYLTMKEIQYGIIIKAIDFLIDRREVLEKVRQAIKLNMALVEEGLESQNCVITKSLPDETLLQKILKYTSAGVEARMSGLSKSAISVAGSGNQGIVTTVPFAVYAKEVELEEEEACKAILLAWLTTLYATAFTKYVSTLCGLAIKAGLGVAAGFGYLLGRREEVIKSAIKNHLATITGIVCDGGKPPCALKAITAVETAYRSAELASKGVECKEGLVGESLEETLRNVGEYVHEARSLNNAIIKAIGMHKP